MTSETLSRIKDMFNSDCSSEPQMNTLLAYHKTESSIFWRHVYHCFGKHLDDAECMFISKRHILSELTDSLDPLVFKDCNNYMVRVGDVNSSLTNNSNIAFEVIEIASLTTYDLFIMHSLSVRYYPIGLFRKIFTHIDYQNILTKKDNEVGFYFTFGTRAKPTGQPELEVMFNFQYELAGTTHTAYFDYSED